MANRPDNILFASAELSPNILNNDKNLLKIGTDENILATTNNKAIEPTNAIISFKNLFSFCLGVALKKYIINNMTKKNNNADRLFVNSNAMNKKINLVVLSLLVIS
jgi:hypothetical protein